MGAVAARLSDVVVVTSDNPRSEPPEAIIDEIQRGMNGGRTAERHAIVDRREAIARALEMAGPGDAVVIAGKGHETYQVLRDRTVPFDDRQVAREVLARLAPEREGVRGAVVPCSRARSPSTTSPAATRRRAGASAPAAAARRRLHRLAHARSRASSSWPSRARASTATTSSAAAARTGRRRGARAPRRCPRPPGSRSCASPTRPRRWPRWPGTGAQQARGAGGGRHRLRRQDHHQGDDRRRCSGARGAGAEDGRQPQQPVRPAPDAAAPAARAPAAVLELGMSAAGELRALSAIARPDVAVITMVAPVHLEFFDSVDAIADAKAEILEGLGPGRRGRAQRRRPARAPQSASSRTRAATLLVRRATAPSTSPRRTGAAPCTACASTCAWAARRCDVALPLPGPHFLLELPGRRRGRASPRRRAGATIAEARARP